MSPRLLSSEGVRCARFEIALPRELMCGTRGHLGDVFQREEVEKKLLVQPRPG